MSTISPPTQMEDAVTDAVQRLTDVTVEARDTLQRIARAVEALSKASD